MYERVDNKLINDKILSTMKKANLFKVILGACIFITALLVDLGSAIGITNTASAQTESYPYLKEVSGSFLCPGGQMVSGSYCIGSPDPTTCTPSVECP